MNRRRTITLPRALALHALGTALAACSPPPPHADAGGDVVVLDDHPPGCTMPMAGRECFTTCTTLGPTDDAGGIGLVPAPCEVYCPTEMASTLCYNPDGSLSYCELSHYDDGGLQVFC